MLTVAVKCSQGGARVVSARFKGVLRRFKRFQKSCSTLKGVLEDFMWFHGISGVWFSEISAKKLSRRFKVNSAGLKAFHDDLLGFGRLLKGF